MIGDVIFKNLNRVFSFLVPLFAGFNAFAADPSVIARLDRTQVLVGEAFRVTVEVREAGGAEVEPTIPKDFEIVGQSSQTSFSFGTGRGSERVSRTVYSIIGTQTGKYQLGPFLVKVGGKKISSNALAIQVVEQATAPQVGTGKNPQKGKQVPTGRDVFLTTSLSKKEVWLGEPFVVTTKFYFRVPVSNSSLLDADFSQFVSFDGKDVPQTELREVVDGVEYNVIEVRKTYAARASGQFQIPAIKLQTDVQTSRRQRQRGNSDDPFDRFNDMFADPFFDRGERRVVGAPPISFSVRSLPEPKPAGWTGVVGDVKLTADISKTNLAVGENATLTVRAEGVADLAGMSIPELGSGDGLKTYADKPVVETLRDAQDGIRQRKVFSVGVVPTQQGHLVVKERSLFVFNPTAGNYEERKIPAFALNVSGVSEGATAPVGQTQGTPTTRQSVRESGSDIFPPKEDWVASSRDDRVSARTLFEWMVVPFILGILCLVLFIRDNSLISGNAVNAQTIARRALGVWKKELVRLKNAARKADGSQTSVLEEALAKAVRAYVEQRLDCTALAMTPEEVKMILLSRGCTETTARACADLLSRVDVGRYAAGVESSPLLDLVLASEKTVAQIEKEVRK